LSRGSGGGAMKELSVNIWYVLRLHPKKERIAMNHLADLGFGFYFPLVRRFKIIHNNKEDVYEPLFNGYLFVKENSNFDESKLQFIRGTSGLLKLGGKLAKVTDLEIEVLKRVCMQRTPIELISEVVVGEYIIIKSGTLKGIRGIVNKILGKQYIYIESGINGMLIKLKLNQNILDQAQ